MLAKVNSGANVGLLGVPVTVEVDIASSGLPSFIIVGLADRAVEESKERVRAAIRNCGADFPARKITVNLAPADLPKEGPSYDLPIALGLLLASGQINSQFFDFNITLVVGELSLNGSLRKTQGILLLAMLAEKMGYKRIIVPSENAKEASIIRGLDVISFDSLEQILRVLLGQEKLSISPKKTFNPSQIKYDYDFSQIKGQQHAKRALEIAASGGHNVLLKGPPGAGKTMLCRAFPSILSPMSLEEALEVTKIYSICGKLSSDKPIVSERPFRSPHHTASYVGIIGGGNFPKPGEVSLAHRGVLFLDELPEFPRSVLEALRQPLEDNEVTISRASGSLTYPSEFILLAAQNPCPCGYLGDTKRNCSCLPGQISKYQRKISGPLLDRIDIYLDVPSLDVDKLTDTHQAEDSKSIRERVYAARKTQFKRFGSSKTTNSRMKTNEIKKFCQVSEDGLNLLKMAISSLNLSARGYNRVLKLSRTIADLANSSSIKTEHLAEALQYRSRDEN